MDTGYIEDRMIDDIGDQTTDDPEDQAMEDNISKINYCRSHDEYFFDVCEKCEEAEAEFSNLMIIERSGIEVL